ncbi:MAG: twin-arginine translocase subunit TatC [Acidimicrobiales bacterium]|jgi:sec-independent protein translocase protein TatC
MPKSDMSFWDHVGELRTRLIRSIIAIAVGAVIGVVIYNWLVAEVFLPPYCRVRDTLELTGNCDLKITDPLDGFKTRLRVGTYVGVVLAMPVLLYQLWQFITPALHRREKKWAIPFVVSAVLLFALGAGLAYYTFERALEFLLEFGGDVIDPLFSPSSYLGLITFMMIAFGVGFEFPILLLFLQLAGVVEPKDLGRVRRYAIVGIVTLAAIITPSGDPISLAALSVPMYIFYELSIVIGHLLTRRRRGWVPRKERKRASADS